MKSNSTITTDPSLDDSNNKGKKGFPKGVSGNPAGRPKGSKNKLSRMTFSLLEDNSEEIVLAIIEKAKAGDPSAQRLCMERFTPPVRSTTIQICLPKINCAEDIEKAYEVLFEYLEEEGITLDELQCISDLLERRRKSIETVDLAEELELIKKYIKETKDSI